jgi:hypothetical protein
LQRYQFHMGVQKIWGDMRAHDGPINAALQFLQDQNRRHLNQADFQETLRIFRKAQKNLAECLDAARDLILPPLKNMTAGEPLRPFLLQKKLVYELEKDDMEITGAWIGKLLEQRTEVQKKVNRIHFKSLGGILALQEKISAQCLGAVNSS